MRVLIVSAFLACAVAAPAPQYWPLAYAGVPILAVAPTIPPGDIQAAVIDTHVKINDQAQYLTDQARTLAEIAAENANEGVEVANDLAKEQAEEAKWAAEEKKWQELSASQTAEAKIAAPVESEALPDEGGEPVLAVKSMFDSSPAEEKKAETPAENKEPEVKSAVMEKAEDMSEKTEVKAAELPKLENKAAELPKLEVKAAELPKLEVKAAELPKPETLQPINLLPAPVGLAGYQGYQALVSPLAYSRATWGSYPFSPLQYLPNQYYTQLH